MKFKKGDRVKLNSLWTNLAAVTWTRWRSGTIIGPSRTKNCWRLIPDGYKTPQTFHEDFLDAEEAI